MLNVWHKRDEEEEPGYEIGEQVPRSQGKTEKCMFLLCFGKHILTNPPLILRSIGFQASILRINRNVVSIFTDNVKKRSVMSFSLNPFEAALQSNIFGFPQHIILFHSKDLMSHPRPVIFHHFCCLFSLHVSDEQNELFGMKEKTSMVLNRLIPSRRPPTLQVVLSLVRRVSAGVGMTSTPSAMISTRQWTLQVGRVLWVEKGT